MSTGEDATAPPTSINFVAAEVAEEPLLRDDVNDVEQEYNIYAGYLPSFHRHLSATQAHLNGSLSSSAPLDESDHIVWRSSTVSWSQSEQNLFFRGLSVYSRWRPDLIAAAVKTKNISEVCEYLCVLEEATRTEEGEGSAAMMHEAAMEVSDEWVEAEERMASELARQEDDWADAWRDGMRTEMVKRKRKEMLPPKAKKRKVEQGDEVVVVDGGDRQVAKANFKEWKAKEKFLWDREDILAHLEEIHLQVLDAIIREDLEQKTRKDDDAETTIESEMQESTPSHKSDEAIPPSLISDQMIDPALLALSHNVQLAAVAVSPSKITVTQSEVVAPARPTPPLVASVDVPLDSDTAELTALSPTSRRRHQKRIYMRRKRAQQRGEAVVTDLTRIKPGRKARHTPGQIQTSNDNCEVINLEPEPAPGQPLDDSISPENEEGAQAHNPSAPKPKVRGRTRFYKIKKEFGTAGINGAWLRDHSMDLFHLNTLGKLVDVYKIIEDVPDESSTTSVSADMLQYLQATVVNFITDVMHHVIVGRELETKSKTRSKVWRTALDQITAAAIDQAAKVVGGKSADRKAHFARLFAHHGVPSATEKGKETGTATDDQESGGESDAPLPSVSPHREIYTPIIRVPSAFSGDLRFMDTLSASYMKEARRSRIARFSPPKEADEEIDLVSEELDEEALLAELLEEDEADEHDRHEEKIYEMDLWEEVGVVKGEESTLCDE
ncbi:hypothetical protein BJ138DRAFT_1113324 [Hygrophoropsis aurantiaca]|uniref:Uncharacterized protein n=1 Tax=Hygrophoropsis aurantiaca TaxID=72124 RepID=A0ACB8ACY1_9AGAM|nr:hypothetical protein BJ138DRAFT_1113324 [Hygrophoropsis aurantiaca]